MTCFKSKGCFLESLCIISKWTFSFLQKYTLFKGWLILFQQLRDDFIGEVMLELTLNTGKRQKDSDKKDFNAGNSLAVQWLRFSAFTAVALGSLVAEEPTECSRCLMQRQFKCEATWCIQEIVHCYEVFGS